MKDFTVANQQGVILFTARQADRPAGPVYDGLQILEGKGNKITQYVLEGAIADKATMPASIDKASIQSDALEISVISGPEGATVEIRGPVSVSDVLDADGQIAFTTDTPGVYTVRLELFPYLPWEGTIEAT